MLKTKRFLSKNKLFQTKMWKEIFRLEGKTTRTFLLILFLLLIGSMSLSALALERDSQQGTWLVQIKEDPQKTKMKKKTAEMLEGYPMERMSRYIAREDKTTAAFLVSIAKKESNWGKRSPKLNGQDCYNYWGYREQREKMGSGGHTCFDSPQDAIFTVAERIEDLARKKIDTPEEMVIWKCGANCSSHSPESVNKWIADVDLYYQKFQNVL